VALVTEYNRRSYKRRSPLHTGRWLPMKTTEARDMRDSLAPPEGDLATTDEVGANKRKKKTCPRLEMRWYTCMQETNRKNVRFDHVLFTTLCICVSVPRKKTVVPTPHLRIQSQTDTHPSKKKTNIASCHVLSALQKHKVAKLNSPTGTKKSGTREIVPRDRRP